MNSICEKNFEYGDKVMLSEELIINNMTHEDERIMFLEIARLKNIYKIGDYGFDNTFCILNKIKTGNGKAKTTQTGNIKARLNIITYAPFDLKINDKIKICLGRSDFKFKSEIGLVRHLEKLNGLGYGNSIWSDWDKTFPAIPKKKMFYVDEKFVELYVELKQSNYYEIPVAGDWINDTPTITPFTVRFDDGR